MTTRPSTTPESAPGTVVCLGETMTQVVPSDGLRLHEAATYAIGPAGAESNVAISLARLGSPSVWAGFVGDDPLGVRVRREIESYGVSTALARAVPGERTGMFVKDPSPRGSEVYYYRAGSAAALMDADYARAVMATRPRWVHLTGVTPALSQSCEEAVRTVVRLASKSGAVVSFDVNYRAVLWPDAHAAAQVIGDIAQRCDVVFVGLDEAAALWGAHVADDVRAHLPGPGTVVVKDGAADCVSFSGTRRTVVSALPVDVVEPVGAGDAFAAGWIHGRLNGLDDTACLRLGHLMAAVALTSHSDVGDLRTDPSQLLARARDGSDWPAPTGAVAAQPLDVSP